MIRRIFSLFLALMMAFACVPALADDGNAGQHERIGKCPASGTLCDHSVALIGFGNLTLVHCFLILNKPAVGDHTNNAHKQHCKAEGIKECIA